MFSNLARASKIKLTKSKRAWNYNLSKNKIKKSLKTRVKWSQLQEQALSDHEDEGWESIDSEPESISKQNEFQLRLRELATSNSWTREQTHEILVFLRRFQDDFPHLWIPANRKQLFPETAR